MRPAIFIHTVCFLLFAAGLVTMDRLDAIFASDRKPIAIVERFGGEARVRPIDLSLWRDIDDHQALYEGDVFVTGRRSYARLVFTDGRTLDLDENSLISLTSENDDQDSPVLITLLQGNVATNSGAKAGRQRGPVPRNAELAKNQIKLVSQNTEVEFAASSASVQVAKETRNAEASIKVISGKVQVSDQKSGTIREMKKDEAIGTVPESPVLTALSQLKDPKVVVVPDQVTFVPPAKVDIPSVPDPLVLAATKKKEVLPEPSAKDFPEIIWPKSGTVLWTTESMSHGIDDSLPVLMTLPKSVSETSYIPVLQAQGRRTEIFQTRKQGTRLTQAINPRLISSVAKKRSDHGIASLAFGLTPGLKPSEGDSDNRSDPSSSQAPSDLELANRSVQVQIRSFADLPAGNLNIQLSKIAPKAGAKNPWIVQDAAKGASGNRFEFVVKENRDLKAMIPLFRGDETFEIAASAPASFSGEGTYFIRNGLVVVKAAGRVLSSEETKQLIRIFDAEFAFAGNAGAYLTQVRDFVGLKMRIAERQLQGEIFVFQEGVLIPIKPKLFEKDPKAISTLFDGVTAFFTEKVVVTELGP